MKKILLLILSSFLLFSCTSKTEDENKNILNKETMKEENLKSAYFAWGCFWCMEWTFEAQEWVKEVLSWYIWWTAETANYDDVSTWLTKHREWVHVSYNPELISYKKLVELFWIQIDPTDPDGQFADKWYHYTTAIFYSNDEEKIVAEKSKKSLNDSEKFDKPVVTKILRASEFFDAEEYHQDYYKKSSFRYKLYEKWSWRKDFKEKTWKEERERLDDENIDLKDKLTDLQYKVTQKWWTEPPFDNKYWDNEEEWIYVDIIDWTPLFSSKDKYKSGTGWPSFSKPINKAFVIEKADNSLFSKRTEIKWLKSDSHLWHVFDDWPEDKWWLRYCMNSSSLRFVSKNDLEKEWYGEYLETFR